MTHEAAQTGADALSVLIDIAKERCGLAGHECDWECSLLNRSIVTVTESMGRVGVLEGQLAMAREETADMRAALERRLLQVKSFQRDGHKKVDPMLCTTPVTTVEEEIEDARLWWSAVKDRGVRACTGCGKCSYCTRNRS